MSLFTSLLVPELIQIIGDELDITDAKSLRLTCKGLGETLESRVLRKLAINLTQQTFAKGIQKLQDWAFEPHAASHTTRELAINSICPAYDPTYWAGWIYVDNELVASNPEPEMSPAVKVAEETLKVCLRKAISSMTSVRTVRWMPTSKDPESAQQLVMDALTTLPNLESLVVWMSFHKAQQRFESLPPLRKLSLIGVGQESHINKLICKSPELRSLSLYGVRCSDRDAFSKNQSLHGVLEAYPKNIPPLRLRKLCLKSFLLRLDHVTLPHLLHLTSLELDYIRDPFEKPDKKFGVFYPGTTDSLAHRDQKLYGSSMNDVWLALANARIHLREVKIHHVSPGFLTYLENYSGLERLELVPHGFEDGATSDRFGCRFFDTSFKNHINSIKELAINAPYGGSWCFTADSARIIAHCTKLHSLSMHITSPSYSDAAHSKLAPLVKLFLDTVAEHLPFLEALQLSAAGWESSRGAGRTAASCMVRVEGNISKVVETYRAPLTCTRLPALQIGSRQSFTPATAKLKDEGTEILAGGGRKDEAPRLTYVKNLEYDPQ